VPNDRFDGLEQVNELLCLIRVIPEGRRQRRSGAVVGGERVADVQRRVLVGVKASYTLACCVDLVSVALFLREIGPLLAC
jgi:hypothetical protein